MSVHNFMKFPDNTMKRTFAVEGDNVYVYRISVPTNKWDTATKLSCRRWVQNYKNGKKSPFRWGKYEQIPRHIETEDAKFICNDCKKTFVCRRGLRSHKNTCKSHTVDLVLQESQSLENTVVKELRKFGNENPRWVTSDLLYGALSNLNNAIPVMMRKKHFNDNFPENRNIRIDTKRDLDHRMQVFEEGRWLIKGSKQTFYKVLVSICDILSDALEEDEELMESLNQITKETVDRVDGEDSDEDEHIGKEIRRLRNCDNFIKRINKIRPLWHQFREKISNPEQRTDLWEDLKTLLLDRQLAIEQGFD